MSEALLAIVASLVGSVVIWFFTVWLISQLTGWGRLRRTYASREQVSGETFPMGTVFFRPGAGGYKNAVRIVVGHDAVQLSLWAIFRLNHPPLVIPFAAIQSIQPFDVRRWDRAITAELVTPGQYVIIAGPAAEAITAAWQAMRHH